ncbi:DUF6602 domain-containing protein [Porphyromonas gingivalis]|uniref:DUF6602 domain-containing protein n=1 Tax=Porphyromonas gingivalis TaxID=837 RepID=A0AAF0BEP2_PORGN|nr:DUF6602 domain-containing protein [Porphyromonas gingivalis]WCG02528.1 hypothetical protein NY151_07605 [Porphyromonas gingivalis]
MNKIDLKKLFSSLQKQMEQALATDRTFILHPGSKGDALENTWIEWLRNYLPNRYSVDKAFVIDCEGQVSEQIDVVIYDCWFTPFVFKQNGIKYIPAEGVYAVFEVKPDIKGSAGGISYIEYASKKIESVRALRRTSTNMINSGSLVSARPLTKIIGGILCCTNSYTHQDDNKTINSHLSDLTGFGGIDCGCIIDYGSFVVDYEGEEDTSLSTPGQFEERIQSYYSQRKVNSISFSQPQNSLVTFFMQLTRYLQQAIGTVPAIDMNIYLSSINETIDPEI